MTMKFNWNAKVTRALTGRIPVHPAADEDLKIQVFNPFPSFTSSSPSSDCMWDKSTYSSSSVYSSLSVNSSLRGKRSGSSLGFLENRFLENR